jgi:hypothetical protein
MVQLKASVRGLQQELAYMRHQLNLARVEKVHVNVVLIDFLSFRKDFSKSLPVCNVGQLGEAVTRAACVNS